MNTQTGLAPNDAIDDLGTAKQTASLYTLAPTTEALDENPALVVLIGESIASYDTRYPAEWVVFPEGPKSPDQYATELGQDIADTPLTSRLRERLPVVLAPHPTMLGELGEFSRADLLRVAAAYDMPAYAVLVSEENTTGDEEFPALPTPEDLTSEGWRSY